MGNAGLLCFSEGVRVIAKVTRSLVHLRADHGEAVSSDKWSKHPSSHDRSHNGESNLVSWQKLIDLPHESTFATIFLYFVYKCRRVAVIRGLCVSQQGLPIMGIRVSLFHDNKYGFTITRSDGRLVYRL